MHRFYLSLLLSLVCAAMSAQDISAVLRTIESGNTQLTAARQQNVAEIAALEAENVIGPTSLEFSPFFHSRYPGIASSELIVTQEFDFPTLYRQRRDGIALQREVADLQYLTLRRNVLLEATTKCYDLITSYQRWALIDQRLAATDSLLSLYTKRLDHGHATVIDYNRIRIDRMTLLTQSAENQAEALRLIDDLQRLGGGEPMPALEELCTTLRLGTGAHADLLDTTQAPHIRMAPASAALDDAAGTGSSGSFTTAPIHEGVAMKVQLDPLTESLETATAEAALTASRHEERLARRSWYPTFTAGFRVNTEMRDANGGFVIGVAFPFFSCWRGKQQAARLRARAAEMALADARAEAMSRVRALTSQAEALQRTLATYDVALMEESLAVLLRAVLAGEISIMDYYPEAERIYGMLQTRLDTENAYRKVEAELHRDEL